MSTIGDELYAFLHSDYGFQLRQGVRVPSWKLSELRKRFSCDEVDRFIATGVLTQTNYHRTANISLDVPGSAGHLVEKMIGDGQISSLDSLKTCLQGRMQADSLQRFWNLVQEFRAPNHSGE